MPTRLSAKSDAGWAAGWGSGPALSARLRARGTGFTLVELMIVITVIALMSAAVVMAMPDPRGRVFDEGARFAMRVRAAHDVAVVEARPVSVWITAGGYGFDQRRGGQWMAMTDKPLRVERWKSGTVASVAGRQRVTFDPTGLADRALDLPLMRDRARVTVRVGADGKVDVDG